jgi:hypothetical protein
VDDELERRLRFFEDAGSVDVDLCGFVRDELDALAADGFLITEETAGMLTSHLLMALQRVRAEEPVDVPAEADLIASQLAGFDDAVSRAAGLAHRARDDHSVALPSHEVDFVALHLATLTREATVGRRDGS